jgi:hypothetical protein
MAERKPHEVPLSLLWKYRDEEISNPASNAAVMEILEWDRTTPEHIRIGDEEGMKTHPFPDKAQSHLNKCIGEFCERHNLTGAVRAGFNWVRSVDQAIERGRFASRSSKEVGEFLSRKHGIFIDMEFEE